MDAESKYRFGEFIIPEYMHDGLRNHIEERTPTGGFLRAVFNNDLKEAVGRADENNMRNLPAYVNYLYNYAPSDCWGSPAKVEAWLRGGKE
jgi:hypothetical protein